MPQAGLRANSTMPPRVRRKGIEKPVRKSRSRLPPVIESTVSIITCMPLAFARSIMARLSSRSL